MKIRLLPGIYLVVSLFTWSCEDHSDLQPTVSSDLFGAQAGTEWVYVNSFSDTTTHAYNQRTSVNGNVLAEFSTSNLGFSYLAQDDHIIYKYAEFISKSNSLFSSYQQEFGVTSDSIIWLSEPSIEYVLGRPIGYKWHKTILVAEDGNYEETAVKMEVTGKANVLTVAGRYDCDVIEDEFGVTYYVAAKGLVKKSQEVTVNDSTFILTEELISIAN